jgi:putative transport protein
MNWLFQLSTTNPVAHAIAVLSLVCVAGMALGGLKVRGIGLGTAGVLFAGIIAGHFGKPVDHHTLEFVKEFGLILFVFTIGLQLGPGFFAAFRQHGLQLNLIAAAIVLGGSGLAVLMGWLLKLDPAAVLGLLSGATTNTPSLGAVQQTIASIPGISEDRLALPALAYAVSYPAAIAGIIGTLVVLKTVFRVDPAREAAEVAAENNRNIQPLERRTLIVTDPNLDGLRLDAIPGRNEARVTISRVRHGGETSAATDATVVRSGDRMAVIGTPAGLDRFERVVGKRSDEDLVLAPSQISFRRVVVTDPAALGKLIGELHLDVRYGVAVTRVTRADIEVTAVPSLKLQFGDMVQIVGRDADLDKSAAALGNSLKELNETHFVPLFIGIFLGIALGTLPVAMPGLPQPVRLGLAGGPLIIALLLGRFGHVGRLVCHMPVNANLAFREFGIALFFAAVGLAAGPKFFSAVFSSTGLMWLGTGLCVTVLPLLLAGLVARAALGLNFAVLAGLLAGSVTDPPALAFATNIVRSDAPTVAYATVYPMSMLLRILCAQVLALGLIK